MSMFSIFEISGSAMTAQSQRMNVTASNMANADSVAGPTKVCIGRPGPPARPTGSNTCRESERKSSNDLANM